MMDVYHAMSALAGAVVGSFGKESVQHIAFKLGWPQKNGKTETNMRAAVSDELQRTVTPALDLHTKLLESISQATLETSRNTAILVDRGIRV